MKNEISDSDEGGETRVGSAVTDPYTLLRRTVFVSFYVITMYAGNTPVQSGTTQYTV